MRPPVFILALLCLCTAQSIAQTFEKHLFARKQGSLPYRLLYPQAYDSTKAYPLLVFLHGSGARGTDNEAQLGNLPPVFLDTYSRSTFPAFILVPQCPKQDAWAAFPGFPQSLQTPDTPTTAGALVLSLIDRLTSRLPVDSRRIYLTGYSMGGEGTFDLISRRPELFAAAVPVCPVADTARARHISGVPLWVFHGADDKVNEVRYSRMMIEALEWQGGTPLYTEYPGVGHKSWDKAYREADLLPWMFSQARTRHPHSDNKPLLTRQDSLQGSVTPERSWWDVLHYDLQIHPSFETRTMSGRNTIAYKVTSPGNGRMQIDLQQPLQIDSAVLDGSARLLCTNDEHVWYLSVPPQARGTEHKLTIWYSGTPHVAPAPPWCGGTTWTRDSLGRPWMATSCQLTGSGVWYPGKDHQGDEPDRGANIAITVPDSLVAVSNGRLARKDSGPDHTTTYHWTVINPVNNYGLCFYAGKYVNIPERYAGTAGALPMEFWVLDYNAGKAKAHLIPNTRLTVASLEYWLGPYPFYEDGLKLVDAPYIGMEHQSAVAYGNRYRYGNRGKDISRTGWGLKYDIILTHELAHEWFGNSISTEDLADKWVHEGFAGYAEILHLEQQFGKDAAAEYLIAKRRTIENKAPVIPRYGVHETGGADDFSKGRALVHMIRKIMADDATFRQLLLDMNKAFYHKVTNSAAVEAFINRRTGINFSPVFDQYLRTVQVPVLEWHIANGRLRYRYGNCLPGFSMPTDVRVGGKSMRIVPTTRWQEKKLNGIVTADTLQVEPDFYVMSVRQ